MNNVHKSVELLKALADTTRFQILNILMDKTMCVKEIAKELTFSQSAISHQLKILKDNHLVKGKRRGKQVFYSLWDDHVKNIMEQVINHIEHD